MRLNLKYNGHFQNILIFQAELLMTESPSLGELCHTKGFLRLPLDITGSDDIPKTEVIIQITHDDKDKAITEENEHNIIDDDEEEGEEDIVDIGSMKFNNHILPTPSCTGSMDSLSSSSASSSDRPPSFTTFGKQINKSHNGDEILKTTSIVFIEDDITTLIECQKNIINTDKSEKYLSNNKHILSVASSQNTRDSTDEDSGFENISRMTK